jgi:hypothetical protein
LLGSLISSTYRATITLPAALPAAIADAARESVGTATVVATRLGGAPGAAIAAAARSAYIRGMDEASWCALPCSSSPLARSCIHAVAYAGRRGGGAGLSAGK